MTLYWDTSALLSLVFLESSSASARGAWASSDSDLAWRWLVAEATAGAVRRRATPGQWSMLEELLADIRFVDLEGDGIVGLCAMNRDWGLRAADAGHVYVFKTMADFTPDLKMVCFDREMRGVVKRMGLPLWGEKGGEAAGLRVRRATYGRGKKERHS